MYDAQRQKRVFARMPVTISADSDEAVVLRIDQSRTATITPKAEESCHSGVEVELAPAEVWPVPIAKETLRTDKPVVFEGMLPSQYHTYANALEGDCFAVAPPSLDLTRAWRAEPVEVLLQPAGAIRGHTNGGVAVLRSPGGEPVLSPVLAVAAQIYKIPLNTSRRSFQGRPWPSLRRFGSGINGSSRAH
jgi:hypothetical protein